MTKKFFPDNQESIAHSQFICVSSDDKKSTKTMAFTRIGMNSEFYWTPTANLRILMVHMRNRVNRFVTSTSYEIFHLNWRKLKTNFIRCFHLLLLFAQLINLFLYFSVDIATYIVFTQFCWFRGDVVHWHLQ